MIIVVKINVPKSEGSIIAILEGDSLLDKVRGYQALLEDTSKLDRAIYSVKNISKTRTEIFKKGFTGSYLEYVYEIFTHEENDDIEEVN